jgi:indole-3-glycerol phosphate synthase
MSETILDKIFAAKKLRVNAAKAVVDPARLRHSALERRSTSQNFRLRVALGTKGRLNIIAEFKKESPSKGVINESVDAASVARKYEAGGAAAISVLTEEDFFKGSLDDLRAVRTAVDLPILRKDFVFDVYQIYEAAEAGADAVLLIAAMLDDEAMSELKSVAEDELGLDALIEVHTLDEIERVKMIGAKLVGVNNRDLKTFSVSLDVSRELILFKPDKAIMISESGLRSREDLVELRGLGYSGFLIGETLMRSDYPDLGLKKLTTEHTEVTEKNLS